MRIPKNVRKVSKLEQKTLERRGLKLTEESGELAAEILKYIGEKGRKGKTKNEVLDHLRLECVDCLLMSMDILCHVKTSDEQITEIMNSQLAKWQKSFDKRK